MNQNVILFDGVCNLCNSTVQWVLKKDRKNRFKFSSLQSKYGEKVLIGNELPLSHFDSFLYLRQEKLLQKSTAALWVVKDLGGLWSLLFVFILIPPFIRDSVYSWVAKNRYRWFGKRESCMMPQAQWKNKFID